MDSERKRAAETLGEMGDVYKVLLIITMRFDWAICVCNRTLLCGRGGFGEGGVGGVNMIA